MSKLGCVCGHTIRDNTLSLPYKAQFIRDQDLESYSDWTEPVNAFIEAIKAGKREQWIANYFSKSYPTTLSNGSIIGDIISEFDLNFHDTLYQCENCGRIKIQIQNTNSFASFTPENGNHLGIFERKR
ncbi:MAG: hypothetical protein EOO60_13180 [Hymenobacter sp.]|nr:MAG: hypothetical protein EOO60_13180 [Hymenobacter sp.]